MAERDDVATFDMIDDEECDEAEGTSLTNDDHMG